MSAALTASEKVDGTFGCDLLFDGKERREGGGGGEGGAAGWFF